MLAANMAVAGVVSRAFPARALLRRHPPPHQRKMEELAATAAGLVGVISSCKFPTMQKPAPAIARISLHVFGSFSMNWQQKFCILTRFVACSQLRLRFLSIFNDRSPPERACKRHHASQLSLSSAQNG